MENINAKLQLVMKSGKVVLGIKQTLKSLRQGRAKLVIIAANTPPIKCVSNTLFPALLMLVLVLMLIPTATPQLHCAHTTALYCIGDRWWSTTRCCRRWVCTTTAA